MIKVLKYLGPHPPKNTRHKADVCTALSVGCGKTRVQVLLLTCFVPMGCPGLEPRRQWDVYEGRSANNGHIYSVTPHTDSRTLDKPALRDFMQQHPCPRSLGWQSAGDLGGWHFDFSEREGAHMHRLRLTAKGDSWCASLRRASGHPESGINATRDRDKVARKPSSTWKCPQVDMARPSFKVRVVAFPEKCGGREVSQK